MPDASTIEQHIRDRLAELAALLEPLEREAETLRAIAGVLDSPAVSPTPEARPARPVSSRARSRPSLRRRGGGRAQQALAKIAAQPGITVTELAKAIGATPNYLYRVLPRLASEGKITKDGHGYRPAPPHP